jgi:uncharacterized protein YdaU (DUF1376 family)
VTENKTPSYPWYPRDFAGDEPVQLMTLEEEGAYRRLLDHQSLHGTIPSDPVQLAKICKNLSVPRMRKLWGAITPCFVPADEEGRLYNRKLQRVLEERRAYLEKKSQAGKAGAEAAWGPGQAGDGKRYVYAMRRTSDGAIKIGVSRSPERRVARLSEALGSDLELIVYGEGGFQLERASQVDLAEHRIGTEWFTDCPEVRMWIQNNIAVSPEQDHGSNQGDAIAKPNPAVASASASARTTPSADAADPPAPAGSDVAKLLTGMGRTVDRWAVFNFLERVPDAELAAWTGRLAGYLQGLDFPAGMKPTPEQLATACRDYSGSFAPVHFRAFVLRAIEGPRPRNSQRPSGEAAKTDRTMAAVDRFVKGGAT